MTLEEELQVSTRTEPTEAQIELVFKALLNIVLALCDHDAREKMDVFARLYTKYQDACLMLLSAHIGMKPATIEDLLEIADLAKYNHTIQ